MADGPKPLATLDYAGGDVPVPGPGPAVTAFVCGAAFVFFSLGVRLGLHNEWNPIFIALWLAAGLPATRHVLRGRRHDTRFGTRPWPRRALTAVVALGWLAGLAILLGPANDTHASDVRRQNRCHSNFEMLGYAIESYASANGGRFPDRPEALLLGGDAVAANFVCQSTSATEAKGATPQDVADALASGGHNSYVYVGKGLTKSTATRAHVVFYEPLDNHTRQRPGIHVLYGDGRVAYLLSAAAEDLVIRMQRDENPPTTQPLY